MRRLLLFALWSGIGLFELALLIRGISSPLFPSVVGADFRALYAAAQVARAQGFHRIYDLEALGPVQQALCAKTASQAPCVWIPMVFPSAFVLPALPLTLLEPLPAFLVWSLGGILLTVGALWPSLRTRPSPSRWRSLALLLVSYPFFANLFWGQINALWVWCLARFQSGRQARRDFPAGLWLAGLLGKPQTLVLLLLGLALAGQWRVLAGFAVAAGGLAALSLALSGMDGIRAWLGWLIGFARPQPALVPTVVGVETMINWRALGPILAGWLPAPLLWGLIGIGMALTAFAALAAWWAQRSGEGHRSERLLLGTLAATLTASWHVHPHTAMILMPSLLNVLREEPRTLPEGPRGDPAERFLPLRWLIGWSLLPAAMPFAILIPMALLVPLPEGGLANFLAARLLFLFHLVLTAWAILPFCCKEKTL